ncbi:receptor-like protein EIX2 [Miscanthus floridulus]|uniref:receptor-like protein EIX2 n=1 Tax=Miscanthus floridulus TaxID=154761 RepID=UPI00345ADE6C
MPYLAAKLMLLIVASFRFFLYSQAATQQLQRASSANDTAGCVPREQDALLAFKQGITNDSSNLLASWRRDQDCCGWTGVTCNNQTGHVVELDLNSFLLVGQISSSLLSLGYLEHLDLGTNFLQGPNASVFPEFLCSMNNLRHLDLSYIPFSGRVPPLLSNLSNLEYLDLSFTSFFGRIPHQLGNLTSLRHLDLSWMYNSTYSTDVSWLSRLHMLEYVDMSNITLSTVTDFPDVANMIPTLKHIILMNCSLPSANQSIANLNLTKLEELDLS